MRDNIKNNVINLSNKEPFENSDNLSSEEKKDKVIDYLKEMIAKIETDELPADQAVLIFYKKDEDGSGFQFSPRTVGINNSYAITLLELSKEIFIREMLDYG